MSPTQRLCLITGNAGKAKEFEQLLGQPIDHEKLSLVEPQALDVRLVSEQKAAQAYEQLGRPVLVDDTAFVVDEWNGLPGALIAWFLDTVGCEGVISMAASLRSRAATVTTALGYADANGVQVFVGELHGELPNEARGDGGFGYDPIFIPAGSNKTFAEMTAEEKNEVSMRKLAVDELRRGLNL